jgi:hypothetical protein
LARERSATLAVVKAIDEQDRLVGVLGLASAPGCAPAAVPAG